MSSSEEDEADDGEDEESKPDLKRIKTTTVEGHFESASTSGLDHSNQENEESEIIYFGSIECRYKEIRFEETRVLIQLSKVETSNLFIASGSATHRN